jgi:hypothetical protein
MSLSSTAPTSCTSEHQVARLVELIDDPNRFYPVVVVTRSRQANQPYVDLHVLADQLDQSAHIAIVEPDWTLALTRGLRDERLAVFGGALRVFPSDVDWRADTRLAPLFLCYEGQGKWVGERIVSTVQQMTYRSGRVLAPEVERSGRLTVATVKGVLNEAQVLVKTESGLDCKMQVAELRPGIEASRLVKKGQKFKGVEQITGGLLGDFHPDRVDDQPLVRAKAELGDGVVTLAFVEQVRRSSTLIKIHPDVEVKLFPSEENFSDLCSAGDAIAVELIWDGDICWAALAREAEAGPSMSVLPGGPPWLLASDHNSGSAELSHDVEVNAELESLGIVDGLEFEEALATVQMLTSERDSIVSERDALDREVRELKKRLRESQRLQWPVVYGDSQEQFRFEVTMSYLTRIPETDRKRFPLRSEYRFGNSFLASVDKIVNAGGISRQKIVDVCVEVLSDIARDNASRTPKPWTDGARGAQISRADGGMAWRVRLQSGTSAARRMKYWILHDGVIELDSVGVHDDGI